MRLSPVFHSLLGLVCLASHWWGGM